jgi:predicted MFS family arabinose efflux permease
MLSHDLMLRFVTLLMMLVLTIANGPAVAAAICQHTDGRAHTAALQSGDVNVSAEAMDEESASKALSSKAALGDAAGTLLAGAILPHQPVLLVQGVASIGSDAATPRKLEGRSVSPLLEPPLV